MKAPKRILVGTLVLLSLAASACGAGSSSVVEPGEALVVDGEKIADADLYADAVEEGSFVFYTGSGEQTERNILDAFEEDTGIEGEILRLAPNKLTERILSEQSAGKLGADVIRVSDANLVKSIEESGAFQKHAVPAKAELQKGAVRANGLYYRCFDRAYAVGYNTELVSKGVAPKSWADLVDTRWKKKLGIVQVGAGGSTASLTRFQFTKLDRGYLEAYAAQQPRIFDSASGAIDAVARGEISVSPMTVGNAAGAISEGAPIRIVFPEEGLPTYEFFVGLASKPPHPAAAKVFLNWTMSEAGQKLIAEQGDYPVRDGIPAPTIAGIKMPTAEQRPLVRLEQEDGLKYTRTDAEKWRKIFDYHGG